MVVGRSRRDCPRRLRTAPVRGPRRSVDRRSVVDGLRNARARSRGGFPAHQPRQQPPP